MTTASKDSQAADLLDGKRTLGIAVERIVRETFPKPYQEPQTKQDAKIIISETGHPKQVPKTHHHHDPDRAYRHIHEKIDQLTDRYTRPKHSVTHHDHKKPNDQLANRAKQIYASTRTL